MALYEGPGTPTSAQSAPAVAPNHNGQLPVAPMGPVWALGTAPPASAEQAEQASPSNANGPVYGRGASQVVYRGGAGDQPSAPAVDDWLLVFRDVPHDGAFDGKQLFAMRPPVPPEGHGGYDVVGDYGIFIDRATQTEALYWSDWNASTALTAGGRGAFTGEHVIIARIAPGSTQGYMPATMLQPNVDRNMPAPWDAAITIGQAAASIASGA